MACLGYFFSWIYALFGVFWCILVKYQNEQISGMHGRNQRQSRTCPSIYIQGVHQKNTFWNWIGVLHNRVWGYVAFHCLTGSGRPPTLKPVSAKRQFRNALFWDNMYIAVYVQVAVFYKYDFEFTKWSTPSELIIYVIEFQIRPENEFEDIFFVTKLDVRARGLF